MIRQIMGWPGMGIRQAQQLFEKNVGMGNNKRKNRIIRHEREDKSDTCKY